MCRSASLALTVGVVNYPKRCGFSYTGIFIFDTYNGEKEHRM